MRFSMLGVLVVYAAVISGYPAQIQPVNLAAAANGGIVSASSTHDPGYAPAFAIDGDRSGRNWGVSGGWNDATENTWPDWLQVDFRDGAQAIDTANIFSMQDDYKNPSDPSPTLTFTRYGLKDFSLQYWDATRNEWLAIPGSNVIENELVWRRVTFPPVTTARIRLVITRAYDLWTRVPEFEVFAAGTNPLPPPGTYTKELDTRTLSNGLHTLTVVATDAAGNRSTATSTFIVQNPRPLIVDEVVTSCRFSLGTTATVPPDATGGWRLQYWRGQTKVGNAIQSAPWTAAVTLGPGTYVFTGVWSKSGAANVTDGPTQSICPAK